MSVKCINVEALKTERHALTLADKIEREVNSFVKSVGGTLETYDIKNTTDLGPGGFGTALVQINYEPKGKAVKGGRKK